jgi:hypothetical protein
VLLLVLDLAGLAPDAFPAAAAALRAAAAAATNISASRITVAVEAAVGGGAGRATAQVALVTVFDYVQTACTVRGETQ